MSDFWVSSVFDDTVDFVVDGDGVNFRELS